MTDAQVTEEERLIERLNLASIGACTCLVKTPVPRYHDARCRYRILQEAANQIERLRETLTFPRITPEAPAEQLMAILHDHDKGRPVNAQDLINALAWRVRNQRREIAKLHERLRKKQSDEAPSFSPNFDERNGIT